MTIKIAAFPKCFEYDIGLHHTMTVFEWISMARQSLQVDGLEMYDRFFPSLDSDYLSRVVEATQTAGFTIPMLICSPDFTNPDPDERKRALDYETRMIQVARFLGGKGTVCRILSGQGHPGIAREQGVEWVIEAIQEMIPIARENDVVLGMENHYKDSQWKYKEFALKMDVFLEIVNAIPERKYFGIQYDPSNAIVAGDDPIERLNKVRDRVVSMHASDRYFLNGEQPRPTSDSKETVGYNSNLVHGVIGKGLNNYERIFEILSQRGFSGWVSIEDGLHGLGEMQESIHFLECLRDKHFAA
jgi:sugar phosphate isomerase/epimerase